MFQYATRCCSCHCCHCLSATNCDYTKQRWHCLCSPLSSAHSTVHTVGYTSHSRDTAHGTACSKMSCTCDTGQFNTMFKKARLFICSVQLCRQTHFNIIPYVLRFSEQTVLFIILLGFDALTKLSMSTHSYEYTFLWNEAQIKPSVLTITKTAANKARHLYVC
jgi:hypothetical protein